MDASRVEAGSHWLFSERLALHMGRQRRDAFARSGRFDIRVQVFRKAIVSPTKKVMGVELIKHALQSQIFTLLRRECAGCALSEPADSDGHNCGWPKESTVLNTLLEAAGVNEEWFVEKMGKVGEVMGGRYSPGYYPEFATIYEEARSGILQEGGGLVNADLSGLFEHLVEHSTTPRVSLLAAI